MSAVDNQTPAGMPGAGPAKRTSTIPAHWTVPAEVSASAVDRPERVKSAGQDGSGSRVVLIALALVVVLGGVGVLTGVIPIDALTLGQGTEVKTSAPITSDSIVKTAGHVADGQVGPGHDAPGQVANSPLPVKEPAPGENTALAAEMIVPAVDNDPLIDVAANKDPEPKSEVDLIAETVPAVEMNELPVRRKVKRLIEKGERYVRKGRYKSAARVLEKAARLDPNFPRVQRSLGIARARLGDYAGARKAYERYLELDPLAPDAADVRRILGQ